MKKKSRGLQIKGGSHHHVAWNSIVGFDEGIVIEDAAYTSVHSNAVLSKESVEIITEIKTFINTLNENIEQLNLSEETIQEIKSDLQTIESQVKSPKPKGSIIIPCIDSIKRVLESAVGGALGASLVKNADKIIALLAS
jgi:hypothetical protein